ncbi:MFS transporter [Gordonia sp. SL306]|uniref:MFS transporter n=1 Tax=Gordonia sp. SL306 TaxID=2995145 RepID=UPI00226E9F6F|nr:MFS transporter [Gordonia sp. SL306]WAC56601.1 MFS transporter [Gordonia sp. SL306]
MNPPVDAPTEGPPRSVTRYGLTATVAFCLLVVGSNIPGPLLPVYRDQLQLSTFTVTALFAAYLAGLVATLTLLSRTELARYSTRVLPVALVFSLTGDIALLAGNHNVGWLFVGRVLVGISVALGTGSAATLVLATRGERGRAIAATGTLAGSFGGIAVSAVVADLLPGPTTTIYYIHIALLVAAGSALLALQQRVGSEVQRLIGNRGEPAAQLPDEPGTNRYPQRLRLAGFALGTAGWAIGGIVVALLPTVFRDMTGSPSIILTALGPMVLIGAACLAPMVIGSIRPPVTATAIAVGAFLCVLGVWADSLPIALLCCLVWGIGQGFAYNNGLKIVTAGLDPVEQGRTASQYASVAYGFTGVLSVTTGVIATSTDIVSGLLFTAAVFVTLCGVTIVLGFGRWPRRL